MPNVTPVKFRATLVRTRPLNWTVIHVPVDLQKHWGKRGQIRVAGEINGATFQSTLFPDGRGKHTLVVNRKMQKSAGVAAGDTAQVILQPDDSVRESNEPAELIRVLKQEKALVRYIATFNPSTQSEIRRWVAEPKSSESRTRRAEQIAERLLETMEAELELPPLISRAFSRDPEAFKGWQLMTPKQRRNQLLAIFYYRTPDARTRRLEKVLRFAREVYEKKSK
jgi:uncharacterized protein YdeI (YjbR/CyaY-like superfamily)